MTAFRKYFNLILIILGGDAFPLIHYRDKTTPLICASMLANYACLLRDKLPPYAVSAIDEQLRFLAAEDTAFCQLMIDCYRELGHDFTDVNGLLQTFTDKN